MVSLSLTLIFCYFGIWLAWYSGFYTLSILFYQGILSTLKSLKLFASLIRSEHILLQHDNNNNVESLEKPNFFSKNSFDILYHLTIIINYLLLLFNYYYKSDIILWGNVCIILAFKEIHMSYMKVRRKYMKYKRFKTFASKFSQVPPEEIHQDEKCSICHESLIVARKVQCGHIFHMKCLYSWLKNNQTCPMCRSTVWENEQLPQVLNTNLFQQFFGSISRSLSPLFTRNPPPGQVQPPAQDQPPPQPPIQVQPQEPQIQAPSPFHLFSQVPVQPQSQQEF